MHPHTSYLKGSRVRARNRVYNEASIINLNFCLSWFLDSSIGNQLCCVGSYISSGTNVLSCTHRRLCHVNKELIV